VGCATGAGPGVGVGVGATAGLHATTPHNTTRKITPDKDRHLPMAPLSQRF
jgi:hypothetical protein